MIKKLLFIPALFLSFIYANAQQDTIVVQTFTYGSPQDAWFEFPPDTVRFEKILMKYKVKCHPPCGEWDYQTSTWVYQYTGLQDSSAVSQDVFFVGGQALESFAASLVPTYTHYGNFQYYIVHNDTISFDTYSFGNEDLSLNQPFAAEMPVSKSYYLWLESELTASGMSEGDISGIRFNIDEGDALLKNMRIRMKHSTLEELSESNLSFNGYQEVYLFDTEIVPGINNFSFLNAFEWNGNDNIIVEISYENSTEGISPLVFSSNSGFNSGAFINDNDRYVAFHGNNYLEVAVPDSLRNLGAEVSVSFWTYGDPEFQPQNGTSFEGVSSSGNRVINAHVPWGNSRVYWDAGNDGGSYDRIDKEANANNLYGNWTHWTMTKNLETQSMKIYLNGSLWHSGSNKDFEFDEIETFKIGRGNWGGSTSFSGKIDEFAIFNTELSATEISENYKMPITENHPKFENLITYFRFNDGNGISVTNTAHDNTDPSFLIGASNPLKNPDDFIFGYNFTEIRPDIVFEQAVFNSQIDSVFVLDSVLNQAQMIVFYNDSVDNPGQATDTLIAWLGDYYNMVYSPEGEIIDSIYIAADTLLINSSYVYYNYFPQVLRHEIARYITPYGNGINLSNGWTWTYDVTDYRTLLADSVRLVDNNYQELVDIQFLMIKGVPPRDIISLQMLWPHDKYNYGYATNFNELLPTFSASIPEETVAARWKSRVTGHGMSEPSNCAEFCPRWHYYLIDGEQRFNQSVWRDDCGWNPLFPQGGTWVYNRSNWCPGAEVETYDFDITPYITPGESIDFKHNAQNYTLTGGWSFYEIASHLVTYGPPNFTLDAAIENVLVPTKDDMWRRKNPACTNPIVIIKNTGATTLTSLEIDYGLVGGQTETYNWTGSLEFLEEEEVTLGNFELIPDATHFNVSIKNPNGGVDEYAPNNSFTTEYEYPTQLPATFVIELKTNNNPHENSYTLKDADGNIILSKSGFSANSTYRDTLYLEPGCYEFKLLDTGNDGLTWWANSAQGSGLLRFRNTNDPLILKSFNSDFGAGIYCQLIVGDVLQNDIEKFSSIEPELNLFPNPAKNFVEASIYLPESSSGILSINDLLGREIYSQKMNFEYKISLNIDISSYKPGIYLVSYTSENYIITKRIIIN